MSDTGTRETGHGGRWTLILWVGAALLWLTPMIAMRMTDAVNWSVGDFAAFGAMLIVAVGVFELAVRASANTAYRAGAAIATFTSFFMVWSTLAVGVIGEPGDPANLMVWGVLAVAVLASALSRFRARGMVLAMLAAAAAEALLAAVAYVAVLDAPLAITVGLIAPWLVSAALFQVAAIEGARRG